MTNKEFRLMYSLKLTRHHLAKLKKVLNRRIQLKLRFMNKCLIEFLMIYIWAIRLDSLIKLYIEPISTSIYHQFWIWRGNHKIQRIRCHHPVLARTTSQASLLCLGFQRIIRMQIVPAWGQKHRTRSEVQEGATCALKARTWKGFGKLMKLCMKQLCQEMSRLWKESHPSRAA